MKKTAGSTTAHKSTSDTSDGANAPQRRNKRVATLKRFSAAPEYDGWSSTTTEERRFYQSQPWRVFRAQRMIVQRNLDIDRAWAMVEQGICTAKDYSDWHVSGKPLCEISYRAGLLVAANVLDHITPINQGGGRFDVSNLQFLSDQEHNRKSARDRRKAK